ncbi:formate--tetrahydrofolate ligase [Halorussus salilacus]|uniref:formate--tetrahydrofolate ligase n=1 Tax=Halorussus salilacus TaxID=2953750 RepID=UPI00209FD971|nr:formate--tetrahydrofolate ligase [Halorussus salilacus]USZ69483.1 formate--tetrahydrofolate ligase [Halorussus salilacus]
MSPAGESGASIPDDREIAASVDLRPIEEVVEPYGLSGDDLEPYGEHKAKLTTDAVERLRGSRSDDADLVVVTGMTPTPMGEGKTVVSVGLGQAFDRTGRTAMVAIREPSLGPVFGIKGGAAGGGYSQVLPMEDINLHFTGDIHALTAAHNLIAAMLDNHLASGNDLDVDVNAVEWTRAIDMNDRALRETVVGLGGAGGVPREDGFVLTAASELMAVLSLADDLADLRERVGRIVVASDVDGDPVTVDDLEATGAVAVLLRDALRPNVVQTIEGTPALVHGGPFANIAHGTNSLIADEVALGAADWVVTEAGFGSDLGAEKFMNVVCRFADFEPSATVLVASVRALKYHGKEMWPADMDALEAPDVSAVRAGFENLDRHVRNLRQFGVPVVVAVNRFPQDTDEEVRAVLDHCDDIGVRAAETTVHAEGGAGGVDLVENVAEAVETDERDFRFLYDVTDPLAEKVETIATEIYGADGVNFTDGAREDIERLEELGMDEMPVVMSKTFHSLSDDPSLKGAPEGWTLDVRELYPSAGAGFVVALTGDVLTLPGLPERPAAADMDVDADGNVSGLF